MNSINGLKRLRDLEDLSDFPRFNGELTLMDPHQK
jgi:hypothetical protein